MLKLNPSQIANKFLETDKPFKVGKYVSNGNVLTYNTLRERRIPVKNKKHVQWLREQEAKGIIQILTRNLEGEAGSSALIKGLEQDVIATRIDMNGESVVVGNSSALGLIGRIMVYGKEKLNRNETEIQRHLSGLVPMIPFSVFQQAHLDLKKMRLIERGPEEKAKRKEMVYSKGEGREVIREVHFTGASLFEIGGNYFLFDIDRREQEHGIFNPFLVKLPGKVETIKAAYVSLIPDEVRKASMNGQKIKRQGEWFFIPVEGDHKHDLNLIDDIETPDRPRRLELRAGNNRPNYAQYGVEKLGLVKGTIEHAGREHAPLKLTSWHKAIPNTAIESFTITGDID